jgi:hypothetical protein
MALRRAPRRGEAQLGFEALSIEGGLLTPEWLARVARLQAPSQSEADYRVPKGLNLRDEIGRYWRIAQALHGELTAGLKAQAEPQALAEQFVINLLHDVFGFSSLAKTLPPTVAGHAYPIGHQAVGGHVPVVIAPAATGLDALDAAFGDGSRRRSSFGLAQEYLNAEEKALWGMACDGVTLRILRDNASLTRPAWIEADLGRIFAEELYADFGALWLLAHETRFGAKEQKPQECALEQWRAAGREEGTRAREYLRDGVEDALLALGNGFLAQRENDVLRRSLQDGPAAGGITKEQYFQELLRLVYRLIFLLTVEERGVLHPDGANAEAKQLYDAGYALRRLRERSVKRSAHDRFGDLWEGLKVAFRGLARGEDRLGLPALGGLFAEDQCPHLDLARLENRALLSAVFRLSWLREGSSLSRVNWRDMGPEELGSVYESLLELVPQIGSAGRGFSFATGGETKGNVRKTTGSYYTPDSLVQVLLDSALDPVMADAVAAHPEDPAEALLSLSIVDPACGSGHFLLAAGRRLAVQVARLRANGTPSAAQYRTALRQVVGRCIFGVDLNPMAVELCRVSLWMEAVEPGRPLSFLDSHIQHGNALLGATPELLAKGVPDAAWAPIEGDNRSTASLLKRRNRAAAGGQRGLDLFKKPAETEADQVTRAISALEAAPDADLQAVEAKKRSWQTIQGSAAYAHQRFVADAWCAAFVWPKPAIEESQRPAVVDAAPTDEIFRQMRDGVQQPPPLMAKTVADLAAQYHFFHWHLQFPQAFKRGGFDVVLGNPPWERVKLQEQEFFASRSVEIANAANAAARKKLIAKLPEENPQLWGEWCAASRRAEGGSHVIRNSGRFPLCGKGDVNTYAVFAEHNRASIGKSGRAGFISPTGIVTDDTTKEFFQALVDGSQLRAIYDFQSGPGLFGAIGHGTFKFALITITGQASPASAEFSFYSRTVQEARSPEKLFKLTREEIALLNPNTRTCSTFRSRRDADLTLGMFRRVGVLWHEANEIRGSGNPWKLHFLRMVDMTNDAALFHSSDNLVAAGNHLESGSRFQGQGETFLPLFEAKMAFHFDHRFGDYAEHPKGSESLILPDVPIERLNNPHYAPLSRHWVQASEVDARTAEFLGHREWLFGWRDVSKTQNERTVVAAVVPRAAVANNFPLLFSPAHPRDLAAAYANLCSFAFDYAARQKLGGTHLNYFVLKQLPILAPQEYAPEASWSPGSTIAEWLTPRVLELTYTAWELEGFGRELGYRGTPFRWDPGRRFQIRCELDAAFFQLYGLARDDVDYVMETFPIVRKNDEKEHNEYRTKRVILETYDALAKSMQAGKPYRTPLDPLPGSTGASHGTFLLSGIPKDYAEALRTGLLFTLIRGTGDQGIAQGTLSRALLWLQDATYAATSLDAAAFADFERIRASDPLLAQGAADSDTVKLLGALENEKTITRDAKGIAKVRAGASIPNWLPQTPTLAKLGSIMRVGLERTEGKASAPTVTEKPTGKVKRA